MNILIGCEFSGIVRDAFLARGHNAISCDLLPSERNGPHIKDDIFKHLSDGWDMLIFFWPCFNLAVSGARWFFRKRIEQERDIEKFAGLMNAPIHKICGENPVGVLSTRFHRPTQIIQPWMFGHGEVKATCLWLVNLPLLKATEIVSGRTARVWREAPSVNRWKNRSRTLSGIANAFAEQWG